DGAERGGDDEVEVAADDQPVPAHALGHVGGRAGVVVGHRVDFGARGRGGVGVVVEAVGDVEVGVEVLSAGVEVIRGVPDRQVARGGGPRIVGVGDGVGASDVEGGPGVVVVAHVVLQHADLGRELEQVGVAGGLQAAGAGGAGAQPAVTHDVVVGVERREGGAPG